MTRFDPWFGVCVLIAAIGSGLNAGVFFAFSTFVIRALGRLPVPQGIAAMQSINVTAINPLFMGVFMGTALVCLVAGVGAVRLWGKPGAILILIGVLLYLLGTFLVTIVGNVPLNDSLAAVKTEDPASAAVWSDYLNRWNAWNHVRTVSSLGAAVCFTLALRPV